MKLPKFNKREYNLRVAVSILIALLIGGYNSYSVNNLRKEVLGIEYLLLSSSPKVQAQFVSFANERKDGQPLIGPGTKLDFRDESATLSALNNLYSSVAVGESPSPVVEKAVPTPPATLPVPVKKSSASVLK